MEASGLFPTMVTQMVAIGEESGQLDGMLGKTADFYEAEVDDAVEALSSLMEPMIMVFLGGLIGGLVVAMYLPIFKLGSRGQLSLTSLCSRCSPIRRLLPLLPEYSACWSAVSSTSSSIACR
jgi:hypothetical protein